MSRQALLPVALLALLSAAIQARVEEEPAATEPLTIYTDFPGGYAIEVLAALKSELAAIMQPLGLSLEWREMKAARGDEVVTELLVVSFKGSCTMQGRPPGHLETGVLGLTHMSEGELIPFVDVSCDHVANLLRSQLLLGNLRKQEQMLGRALARVMAHEFYHVFAETTRHAPSGPARASFSVNDLLSTDFRFRPMEQRLLREGRLRNLFRPREVSVIPAGSGP